MPKKTIYWEQCPSCGHWMLLVVKLRFVYIKSCYAPGCTYWEMGGTEEEYLPEIPGVSYQKGNKGGLI